MTGATGFVGRHVVPAFADRHDVACIVRRASTYDSTNNATIIEGDLREPALFERLPAHADGIIHLAQAHATFQTGSQELLDVNVASTVRLAEYGRRAGISLFVYASTGAVYAPSDRAIAEDGRCEPSTFYAVTKWCSEQLLRCYEGHFDVAILRLFAPYGPGQTARMIPRILESVLEGRPVSVTNGGEPKINPIYVDDVASVLVQALSMSGSYTTNVAGPDAVSIMDIAVSAGRLLGLQPQFDHSSGPRRGHLVGDTTRMHRRFQADDPVRIDEGLTRTLAWMRRPEAACDVKRGAGC